MFSNFLRHLSAITKQFVPPVLIAILCWIFKEQAGKKV